MREIGSEFHSVDIGIGQGITFPREGTLVFSGRTAIEAVLNKLHNVKTAVLPSYCCDSMIEPFRRAGIQVNFYNVNCVNGMSIDAPHKADVLLWCNYFGFRSVMPQFDGVIIEDITHSFFSDVPCHQRSDFLVASLRKWEPIYCGGYCSVEIDGKIPPDEFITLKSAAMELKTEYLEKPQAEKKERFLKMFSESNHWLAENYSGSIIDSFSRDYIERVDVEGQRKIRRDNARVLYERLKNKVQFMFPIEDMDCPLFVPIILPNRNEVRTHLTKNEIYCPVHWPKPEGAESNIYDKELSLICDQRYGIEDMKRIVSVIKEIV